MTQLFEIRDNKNVYNKLANPAVVFDKQCGTVLAIGEYDDMVNRMNHMCDTYTVHGFPEMVDPIAVIELPKDQDEIDKVFQITGYILRLYERLTNQ